MSCTIKPVKIVFVAAGTYNQQYIRPYEADPKEEGVAALRERTKDGTAISPSNISTIASSILKPSAMPSRDATIVSGWGEDRYRFMFMFDIINGDGTSLRQILSGYTNYAGVAQSGAVDPMMELHINSSFLLRPYKYHTDRGEVIRYNQVSNSGIISNPNQFDPSQFGTMVTEQVTQRPQDLFDNLSATQDAMSDGAHELIDYRTQITTNSQKSDRCNNSISGYLSRSLNAHKSAIIDSMESRQPVDIRGEASGYAADAEITSDPILSTLAFSAATEYRHGGTVLYKDMCAIIPGFDETAYVLNKGQANTIPHANNRMPHVGGQTESLHTPCHNSVAVTILSNAITANMADTLLTGARFTATNQTMDGTIAINMDEVFSFMDGVDVANQANYFMQCLRTSLMDMSFGNTRTFMISVSADIYGETYIDLSMDGAQSVPYCVPSFADSMLSPVLCAGSQALNAMASDIENVSTHIQGNLMNSAYNPYMNNY